MLARVSLRGWVASTFWSQTGFWWLSIKCGRQVLANVWYLSFVICHSVSLWTCGFQGPWGTARRTAWAPPPPCLLLPPSGGGGRASTAQESFQPPPPRGLSPGASIYTSPSCCSQLVLLRLPLCRDVDCSGIYLSQKTPWREVNNGLNSTWVVKDTVSFICFCSNHCRS